MENDNVNHPSHYCEGRKYEPVDVAEDWGLDKDAYLFNAFKYIARAGRKGPMLQDLEKAVWYLNRRIQQMRAETASVYDTNISMGDFYGNVLNTPECGRIQFTVGAKSEGGVPETPKREPSACGSETSTKPEQLVDRMQEQDDDKPEIFGLRVVEQ